MSARFSLAPVPEPRFVVRRRWLYSRRVDLDDLPRLDEHDVVVAAPAAVVWDAVVATFGAALTRRTATAYARAVGCRPSRAQDWEKTEVGASLPGFRIVAAVRPHVLALAGRHRFSRYGIVVRVDPAEDGVRCRLESRAVFPGLHGAAYRTAVVSTGFHVLAVRRLLGQVQRRAEAFTS